MLYNKNCINCKNDFSTIYKIVKYCGQKCYHTDITGKAKKKSQKWHDAIVASNKARIWTSEQREKSRQQALKNMAGWNKGKKMEDPTKHPNWKGGTSINYYKKIILKRDNYTCQVCGLYDSEIMAVDHIKNKRMYPDLSSNLDNMQALCPNCHTRKTKQDLIIIRNYKKQLS